MESRKLDEPTCREGMETQIERMDLWTQWGRERMGKMEKEALTYIDCCCCCSQSLQLCPTLCDPMDYSPPGSPVHGSLQARVLEWGAIAFSDSDYRLSKFQCRASLVAQW